MRTRLLVAFIGIAVTGALVLAVAVRVLVPPFFDHQNMAGEHAGEHGMGSQRSAMISALNLATVIALVVAVLVAVAVAVWLSRREVAHFDELRSATRRMAGGDYAVRVQLPQERELAALALDINHLASTLAETEQHRAALVNDVAHEMRTPLTSMAGVAEGYRDGLYSGDELADVTVAETARLQRLAADLAAVSRAEEARLVAEQTPDDLAEVGRIVVERFRRRASHAGIELDLRATDAVPARIDRERVVQAVTNLLDNAVAYTPAGGRVTVTVDRLGDAARLTVADTGRGLRDDELGRVFERFYRADPAGRAGGTGIGLTIARSIARAHGGDLVAASPGPGQGSTFVLTVPALPSSP